MPELPEIEHLRQCLESLILDAKILKTRLLRKDFAHPPKRQDGQDGLTTRPRHLLCGMKISRLHRHGKQLAIVSEAGNSLCIHLGMSGQLRYLPRGTRLRDTQHVHCIWSLQGPSGEGRLVFRDPRRFGGIWCFDSLDDLRQQRWSRLGPDALHLTSDILKKRLAGTRRPIKAALLDQSLIAGIGNIYADEGLFAAGILPTSPTNELQEKQFSRLNRSLRRILSHATKLGGSTIRSYVDTNGRKGLYASRHKVYGRAGRPCVRCGTNLVGLIIAQRSTVFCPTCQA